MLVTDQELVQGDRLSSQVRGGDTLSNPAHINGENGMLPNDT